MSKKPTFKFKSDISIEERKNESARILRDCPNRVPVIAEVAPDSKDIPRDMKKLLDDYYGKWKKYDVFEREALFNIEFLRIHPFEDGNGRTSRLILNFNLLKQGHAPVLIKEGMRDQYFKARDYFDDVWIKQMFESLSKEELYALDELIQSYEDENKMDYVI